MANVVDTKLYDILGVTPSATENELKRVITHGSLSKLHHVVICSIEVIELLRSGNAQLASISRVLC